MKKPKLPKSLLVTLAAPAVLALAVPAGHVFAQGQTETKIRLMADALRARDSGDLETAKKNLEELLALAPNDATVQRLLSGVNASIAAGPAAATVVEDTPAASEPVVVSMPGTKKVEVAPVLTPEEAAAAQAEDLVKQEEQRIKGLLVEARAKRGEARRLAKDGLFDDAAVVLDGAINSLPANPATEETIADLQAEKNGLLLEKAQYALAQGDTVGARKALDAYAVVASGDRKVEKVSRSIDRVELDPPLQPIEQANPRFIVDQKKVAALEAKGRSQYLAGDLEGAQETFRSVEALDSGSPVAKSFLTRIANERSRAGELNRVKTRAQLLQEVNESWNRPGIYTDQVTGVTQAPVATLLARKLNEIIIPSINFNAVEMSRVISTLSAISQEYDKSEGGTKGVNIVLENQATKNPPITITLRGLSLRRILDLVTASNGFTYDVTEDTVLVRASIDSPNSPGLQNEFFPVTRATVLRMTGIGAAAATPAASADPFAAPTAAPAGGGGGGESGALQSFLEQAGVPFTGIQGASLVYDGSAIIVNQTQRNIEKIRNILNRYNDVRQVEIETKFLDVQQGVLDELGVNWSVNGNHASFVSGNRSLANAFASTSSASQGQIVRLGAPTLGVSNNPATPPGSVDIGNSVAGIVGNPVSGFDYGSGPNSAFAVATGVVGEFDVAATIRALSRQTGTDLMSAPKVTVLSGNPANIVIAQELRYPQSYGEIQSDVGSSGNGSGAAGVTITPGTPQEFTMRNVGVELKVTPTVEEDNYSISLDLNPKVTEFEGFVEYGGQSVAISGNTTVTMPSGFFQPIFSTREITTKVTVWDGATLVMGGLTREEVRKVNDKIPVLGDIPFFGRAFRSSGETSSKRNLLIFVTANLVTPGGSPKKQQLKYTSPAAIFQNPTVVTPGGAESRSRNN